MLEIRGKQMGVLSEHMRAQFENRMLSYLGRFFPRQCEPTGEARTRETIQYGMQRAADYGIVAERDVCRYIHVMFCFGRDFDADPAAPWAAPILNDEKLRDQPTAKAMRLWDEARRHPPRPAAIETTSEG